MLDFLLSSIGWLYSLNGLLALVLGAGAVCVALDGQAVPKRLRTALLAVSWPVWLAVASPLLVVLFAIYTLQLLSECMERLDHRGQPLPPGTINPRRWRLRAAPRGSDSPAP